MKNKVLIIFAVVLGTISIILFGIKQNNTMFAKKEIGESTMYSKTDIEAAMKIVLKEFKTYPATLKKLWYEENIKENEEWAKTYNAEEAIVLRSNFKTYSGSKAMEEGLNSNSEYSKWQWILVRTNKGNWELKNQGQG